MDEIKQINRIFSGVEKLVTFKSSLKSIDAAKIIVAPRQIFGSRVLSGEYDRILDIQTNLLLSSELHIIIIVIISILSH